MAEGASLLELGGGSSAGLGGVPPSYLNGTDGHPAGYQAAYLYITDNHVTDHQLTTSLWLNAVLGTMCFLAFCVLQRSVFPLHYRYRLHSPWVTVKPRALASKGFKSLWHWLTTALSANEADILRSSGLDAMVMIKALSMGVQIFTPLALIGCAVLLPIHYQYRALDNHDVNRSQLMQLTIAALPRGSVLMWVHFVLIVLYNFWVMFILYIRYKQFVIVRQHYLVRGDDPNYWMALTHQAEAQEFAVKVQNLLAELNKQNSKKAAQHGEQQGGGNDEPPPPAAPTAASPQLTVRESSPSTTSFKNFSSSMVRSWNNMVNSMTTSWRGRPGLLQQFQRSSFESYKPYTNENTPAASPPVMSPHASSLGGVPHGHGQQPPWGVVRGRGGGSGGAYTGTSSSDGLDSGGEGSVGDGLGIAAGPAAAAAAASAGGSIGGTLALSAGGADSSCAAGAAAAGSLSGGSSRRWSGSSGGGGASDGGAAVAARGADGSVGDFGGRRLRIPGKAAGRGSRGSGVAAVMAGGVPPTHQTISELHSMPLHGPVAALQDAPWPPLMPKHMRTITEDSLEYRLDSSQGNTSRPSSRGGVLSGVGHNRGSSGGTGDFSTASPSSVGNSLHCRTPTSALSASLAAAGMGEGSGSLLHRHSHSNSGGSGSGGLGVSSTGVGVAAMSPLSRATSATGAQQQPGTASSAPSRAFSSSSSHQQQPGDSQTPRQSVAADINIISGRGSMESLGPSSVCTRITHNSSGRSSPLDPDADIDDDDDDEVYSSSEGEGGEHSNSVRSSRRHRHAAALAQAACSSRASTASAGSTAIRDISFGGGLAMSQQDAAAMGPSPEQVYLSGLGDTMTPPAAPAPAAAAGAGAAAAGQGPVGSWHIRHGYETSVDFSALHLEDLSRAETPLSPEDGGLLSPEPIGKRRSRVAAADSSANSSRWSPFANCEQIASTIAAQGVAGEDFWSVGVERVQGVHSNPAAAQQATAATAAAAAAAAAARGSAGGQGRPVDSLDSNKQRFLRPGPGWQPPSSGAAASAQQSPTAADGSQDQQQQQQQQAEQSMQRQVSPVTQQQQPAAGASYVGGSAVAGAAVGSGDRSSTSTSSLHARSAGRLGSSSQDGPAAQGQQQRGGSSEPSSSGHTTRAGSSSGVGRPQRTRVGGPWTSMSSAGGAGGSGRNSSEPSPSPQLHHSWLHGGWQHQSWQQGSRGTGSSAATSNSNSHMVSPFASTFTTPRGDAAVAGAAVGSGLELTAAAVAAASGSAAEQYAAAAVAAAGVAAPAAVLASGVAERLQEMLDADGHVDDEEGDGPCRNDDSRRVAFDWWKEIPKPMRKNQSASCLEQMGHSVGRVPNQQVWAADNQNIIDDMPLLAKPSVRFRKTINTVWVNEADRTQRRVMSVNAQHYAVLVTDVKQWPYPEMQWEYEAARRRTLYHRAWDWVIKKLSTVPQSISWGLLPGPDFHFVQHKQPQHEQQHLLAAHTAEQPSDKHCLELQQLPRGAGGTAFGSSIAGAASVAAGNTSGGASVPSRGQAGRGQMSSCATSSEGIGGGAAGGMLGRISMASHASHMSHVADMQGMDPDDLLMSAEDKLAAARQQVLQSMDESNSSGAQRSNSEAERNLAKIEKAQAEWQRIAQERERQHALSREHSYLHLAPTSRTTSYMRLGGAAGYNAAAHSGAASLMTASRASSFRSTRLRGDAVLGGAAGGAADWSHRGGAGGVSGCPTAVQCSRSQTPASLQASSEAGSYSAGLAAAAGGAAVPLTTASAGGVVGGVSSAAPAAGRLTDPLVQHQRQSSLRAQRMPMGSPRLLDANDADVPLHMYRAGGSAPAAGTTHTGLAAAAAAAVAAAVAANERASQGGGHPGVGLDQALSEPLTSASMQEPRPLQQQLSQPSMQHMDAAGAATATALAQMAANPAAAARVGSSGSHGMLLGELSLEQPLPQSAAAQPGGPGSAAAPRSEANAASAADAASGVANATAGSDRQGRSTAAVSSSAEAGTAAPGSPFGLHNHRRYVYRSVSPTGASPDHPREADAAITPCLGSTDKGLWVCIPASPRPCEQQSGWDSVAASAAATPAAAGGGGGSTAVVGSAGTAAPAGGMAAASAPVAAPSSRSTGGGAYATATGVTDSYDSNASSYAARRPVGTYRPYPPDSPRALQQQQLQQQSLVGLSQRELLSSSYRTSPVAGAAIGGHVRAYRSFVAGGHHGSDHAAASAAASRMGSYVPGSGQPSHGSSGGGMGPLPAAAAGGSAGGAYPAAALAAGRSRSGRLSISQADGHQGLCHPEHLSLLIPPTQQHPLSRVTTPGGSGGGFGGSGGGLGGSGGGIVGAPVMPLQPGPWGLPADAALLSSSASLIATGAGSPGALMAMRGRPGLAAAPSQHHLLGRWSLPGGPGAHGEERSTSVSKGGLPVHSHTVSPLNSDQDGLIPAGVVGNQGSGFSRAASGGSSEAGAPCSTRGNYIAAADSKDPAVGLLAAPAGEQSDLYCLAGDGSGSEHGYRKVSRWARVRQAFEDKELQKLLMKDEYSIVTSTFKRLFPKDFDTAIPVINHKKVDALLMQWEAAIAERERALLKLKRTGREPMRFSGKLGSLLNACTACGCAGCPDATDLCGSCCQQHVVEVIPEIEGRIAELEEKIEAARRNAFTSDFTPSWFVLFKSQQAATMAASTRIYAEDSTQFQVHPAPGPEEVNWQHLWMTWRERDCRTILTWPLMLLVVLFPITLVTSAASRLEYVFCPQVDQGQPTPEFVWEWYCNGREAGGSLPSFMRAFITGWLPSLLLNLWLVMVLPRLVYLLVQTEGSCFSLSALERRIGAVFFYWDIFNVFLQGLIGSTFFQQVHKIIQSPAQLPNILGAALPDSSNFFMQFIAMRALFLIWLRMCVPHGGVWQNWCHFCWCPKCCCSACNTERDRSLTYGPRTPRYGFEMGHILLMYLIALAFAIVSPLLLPFSVVWFAFAWVAWRHNLSYVYQRKYESGGLMWIFLFSRIVMCLVIGQLFTFCVLVVRGAYWQAFLIIAFMPALTARYFKYCQARFARGVEFLPLDLANNAPKARVPALAYIPPPLQASSWGWYPEWQKIWDGWGMPAYSL